MTTESTPEERAYNKYPHCISQCENKLSNMSEESFNIYQQKAFLSGRRDFIEHDLHKLLELAREESYDESSPDVLIMGFKYTIEEIIAKAKGGV